MTKPAKIRILVADDHAIVRMGLAALLKREKDMSVVGEAEDGLEAVEQAERFKPDIRETLASDDPIPDLTERQMEILQSVTRGLTNNEIAKQYGITYDGVKSHLKVIFSKLGVTGRAEAISIALRKHLLKI